MSLLKKIDIEKSLNFFSLKSGVTARRLKKRYRELIKLYHPDKHPNELSWSTAMMQKINEAYSILKQTSIPKPPVIYAESGDPFVSYWSTESADHLAPLSIEEIESEHAACDRLMENSVLTGWLQRTPRDNFARGLRNRIAKIVNLLQTAEKNNIFKDNKKPEEIDFFSTIFSVFLRATDFKRPGHFPSARNTTKYFRHFTIANRYLDSGVRQFYRYRETGRLIKYRNVPLSFLDDSIRLYSFLIPEGKDNSMQKIIKARIELARLFQVRTTNRNLWNPWP